MSKISFKDQVVVITGAGSGIGRVYAHFFAERGANVLVNDVSKDNAERTVREIQSAGGKAHFSVASVTDGAPTVIQDAQKAFGGRIDILINNAGILRDKSFKNMSDQEFDLVIQVHLKGAFAMSKAVWPIMRTQKYGRIINTASAAGLYGNMGQANYSAAKMGLIGFTKTLAREGAKYNILVNVIAPMAASAMTETIMPPEMLKNLKPEFVAPFVGVLVSDQKMIAGGPCSGRIFEVGAGFIAEVRWERSEGVVFKTDDSFTPSAVKEKFSEVQNFNKIEYPQNMTDKDVSSVSSLAKSLPSNKQSPEKVSFKDKTIIITGAGAGLGRAYALMYAKLGGNIVVNDVSEKAAKAVCDEITKAGGKAIPAVSSAEDGEGIVQIALKAFGTVHVLVANAGILRDKSFQAMTEQDWDQVIAVHLRGTFKCAKAVWPVFQKQKFGRIVTTCSAVGIYGNFGQANYSTAKAAILGLTRTLAIEGHKYNIFANCLAPSAGTAMTQTIWSQEMVDAFKPEFVAPVVGYLSSEDCETTGSLFEVSGGWAAQVRWQRAGGFGFPNDKPLLPEDIIAKWKPITNFDDGRATHPTSTQEAIQQIVENFDNTASAEGNSTTSDEPDIVKEAKAVKGEPMEYTYSERDVIIYALGVGATEKDLQWTYEGDENFTTLPAFGVIPQFQSSSSLDFGWVPNFNPTKLLHGEQYLKIFKPIPISGTLVSTSRVIEVLDKGKAAAVTVLVETVDKSTGEKICENQSTVMLRGSGGFGGKQNGEDRGAATSSNKPPKRNPDKVVEEKTSPAQAALYRQSGDLNPLHIDPSFASMGGFDKPILHGLCSFGISAKHVQQAFGEIEDVKARFVGVVYPGETLVTYMWQEGDKVVFVVKVKERDTLALSAAAATLKNGGAKAKAKL